LATSVFILFFIKKRAYTISIYMPLNVSISKSVF